MSHVRTQIRQAFKDTLDAAMPGHKVFSSRKYAINSSELPIIDMKFLNENSEFMTIGRDLQQRSASLYVRVTHLGTSEDIDDVLDQAAVDIETAVAVAGRMDGLLIDIGLMQTNFTDSADGDKPLAELVLRYDVVYRAAATNPEISEG